MDDGKSALHLDDDNPWPGLAAYDEASQRFFHGREADSAELLRLIRLSPFVTLYGKSGLGKSSMLQAGLFPQLRAERFLPVHLRLDYSEKAEQPPLVQAALRLRQEIDAAGADAPLPADGESLWAYLQRRERPIWTTDNYPLTPVLVFDQFEEVFAVGGSLEHVKEVLDSMADLVGDRLSADLAEDRDASRRLNLQSQQYRVVLSFRSDFLADVESWEKQANLPKRESLHLTAMSRERAIDAVERAGAAVLETGVAAQIVDFLLSRDDGATPGRAAEVEPVLLSLCCYQLNSRRKRPAKIDAALLHDVGKDILQGFYHEALAGMGPKVSVFIEDNLIQGGRYRSSYPRDEALASGALTLDELDRLTHRRLLRVDPQGEVPRIELIHDRLVSVVREGRDARLAREQQQRQHAEAEQQARNERERERAEQAESERARVARWRNGLAAALMLLMFATGWLIYFARDAWQQTERANAETARANVETDRAKTQALRADEEAKRANSQAEYAKTNAGMALWQAHEALNQKRKAEVQRKLAQGAEARALASSRRAEALRLVVEAQAMLSGTMAGGDARAFQQLLAARQLQPGSEVEGSLLDALTARQHLRRFAPVEVRDGSDTLAVAFSRDGRLLATGHRDGSIALRSVADPKSVLARASGHEDLVQMVSFSADGRLLLSASNDGTVRQWRVESGLAPQGQPLSGHEDAVYAAAYNRDASMIVSGGEDGTVRLWDARSGQPAGEPRQMNTGPVWGVAFSPDGQSIAVATGARATPVAETWSNLILLDADARREKASLYAHAKPTMSLAFSPSGRYVVTGGQDSTVRVRDLGANQSQSVRLSGHKGDVQSVAFSPDGHTVASGSADKTVRLWLASSGEPLGLPLKGHDNAVTSVAFSPDGSWLASGGEDGTMQVWQLDASWATPSGQPAPEPPLPDPGDRQINVESVALTADGMHSVFGRSDGSLLLRDEQARSDRVLTDARDPAGSALAPCRRSKAAARERRTVRGDRQASAETPRGATSVAFSASGNSIVSGHQDGSVHRWDAKTGQPVGEPIRATTCAVTALTWSADSRRLAVASEGQALLLDAGSGALLQKLPLAHEGEVSALALSVDGKWLASAGVDMTLRLRDAHEGTAAGTPFEGLLDVVTSLGFSPDGDHLVSGDRSGSVRVWDWRSRRSLGKPLDAHRGPVVALAFMPDGTRFLSAGRSGVARPWPAPQSWDRLMCAKLDANLSRKAWKEWVSGDIEYPCQCPGLPIEPDDPGSARQRETCPAAH